MKVLLVALAAVLPIGCARAPASPPRSTQPAVALSSVPLAANVPAGSSSVSVPAPAPACARAGGEAPADLTELDAGLREAITRAAAPAGPALDRATVRALTCAELAAVEKLELGEVQTLRGIERLPGLKDLSVTDVKDGDISPLANSRLRRLALGPADSHTRPSHESSVHDFAPLAALRELEELRVNGARLKGLEPLASLSRLQKLELAGAGSADLTPLAGLKMLRELRLSGNPLSDLSPLAGLSGLELLVLDGTRVVDVSPIADLPVLRQVLLCGTPVIEDPNTQIKNRAALARLRRRHVAVPDFHGCHCC